MNAITDIVIDLNRYPFSKNALSEIAENKWVKSQWPLVYIIKNDKRKLAYVGETTNAFNRIKNHFANEDRLVLNTITLIGSDRFNKSATLDIESQLIQYLSAENTYKLQNGNGGLTHHNYYERPFYRDIFKEIWARLKSEKLVSKTIEEIENSDLFKYFEQFYHFIFIPSYLKIIIDFPFSYLIGDIFWNNDIYTNIYIRLEKCILCFSGR